MQKIQNKNWGMKDQSPRPEMTVILITPDRYETVRCIVQALRQQTVKEKLELVIVGPSRKRLGLIESDFEDFADYQILEINHITSTSFARASGVQAAQGPVVALTEDHCFPIAGWAEALIERHREPWAGVGPVICNANPGTAVSWGNFLIEYGDWADPISPSPPDHIPGHNSSYKRNVLLEYGPELSNMLESESPMQWDMMARGHKFCMEPKAKMYHLNFSVLAGSISLRFNGGRLFASHRAHKWSVARRLLYFLSSPLIPLVRLLRTLRAANRIAHTKLILRIFPILCILLAVDGLGEMVGYVTGAGKAMQKLSDSEFHRERYLVESERMMTGDFSKIMSLMR